MFNPKTKEVYVMKPLRQKMIRAMELRNLAKGTQRNYLLSVIGVTRYYQKSPDKLSKEMVEDYLLYLVKISGVENPALLLYCILGIKS